MKPAAKEPAIVKGSEIIGEGFQPMADYKVKAYDFKRPDKFSLEQIRTLAIMHETFARLATTRLFAMLRLKAELRVAAVDQLTYEEFIRSIPVPTTLAVLGMDPLKGRAVIEVDPALTFAIIDRLFGGSGEDLKMRRDLTDIEASIMEGIIVRLLANLQEAWAPALDLSPRLLQIETNPQFAQIVPPTEMVVLVSLETRIGEVSGMVNLCLPFLTIEPIIPKLSAQYWYSMVRKRGERHALPAADLSAAIEVSFQGEPVSLQDLGRLGKGSLVRIPAYAEGKTLLKAGGCALFRLIAEKDRKTGAFRFVLEDSPEADDLSFLMPAGAEAEETSTALERSLRPFAEELGGAMKAIDAKVSELAKRQEELSDQLAFENPERELAPLKETAAQGRPFERFAIADCETIFRFLAPEHPQTMALVLSYLSPSLAACILQKLPDNGQVVVAERIAKIGRIPPEVLREVERSLMKKLESLGAEGYVEAGGIRTIAEILNLSSRGVEKNIVESLERDNPDLAEDIKKNMFVFEDISILDEATTRKILEKADSEDLLLAMKTLPEKMREVFLSRMPGEMAGMLKAKLAKMGSVRLAEVEKAQQRIITMIRIMDESGEIVVARPDERV